jgi:phosphohistidine swiveling domain-containing protein
VSAPAVPRLLPLGGEITRAGPTGPAMLNEASRVGRSAGPGPVGADEPAWAAGLVGAKAARLALAAMAGLPVLPGQVIPVAEGRPALGAGVATVRQGRPAAARRAVLAHRLDDALAADLRQAVAGLGGRVIARSSSPLEADPRWSGAFSSVAEVGPDDVTAAVRSCWASAFAVDPLKRLEACGLPPEALELGVLLQPEIRPAVGGVAWVRRTDAAGAAEVTVEGVRGHPGALLSGWADGASAIVRLPAAPHDTAPRPSQLTQRGQLARSGQLGRSGRPDQRGDGGLAALIGTATVAAVADLAHCAWRLLGDELIEWAADDGGIWLLQSQRSAAAACETPAAERLAAGPGNWADRLPTARASMPLLAATVLRRGEHVPGRSGAPGTAAGRLVAVKPHERPADHCGDAILLVDQPVPALAPLLFAARGIIARTGAAGSHLAEVARSLGVPMVLGCRLEQVTGGPHVPDEAFLAAIDGSTGDVALLAGAGDDLWAQHTPNQLQAYLHHLALRSCPRDRRAASEPRWRA